MNFVQIYLQMLAMVVGIFVATALLSKVVSTRKLLHISIGPVFMWFTDKYYPMSITQALLMAAVPMSSAVGFLASKWLAGLGFLRRIVTRKNKLQLTGVVVYGVLFSVYPFWRNTHFRAGLLTLAFGDGFAAFGGSLRALVGKALKMEEKECTEKKPQVPPMAICEKKSFFGSLLCFACATAGLVGFGYSPKQALCAAALGTLGERVSIINDNLVVVAAGALGSVAARFL